VQVPSWIITERQQFYSYLPADMQFNAFRMKAWGSSPLLAMCYGVHWVLQEGCCILSVIALRTGLPLR